LHQIEALCKKSKNIDTSNKVSYGDFIDELFLGLNFIDDKSEKNFDN